MLNSVIQAKKLVMADTYEYVQTKNLQHGYKWINIQRQNKAIRNITYMHSLEGSEPVNPSNKVYDINIFNNDI